MSGGQHFRKEQTHLSIFIGPGIKRSSHAIIALKETNLNGFTSEKLVRSKEVLESD